MDDATFTPDTAAMKRRRILELLAIIRSLFCKESSADDDAAATAAARNRNVVEGRAKEGVRLINDQMTAVSTELLLTVMSDMMLLRLLDGLGVEEGRAVPSSDVASDEQLMDDAAVAKKMKRAAVAAAKKKRNKRNKAAAKHKNKKIELMSWLGGGLISLIMMIAFGSITMLIFPLSLIHRSDGSGEGNTPPALPPSASKSLRQKDHQSNDGESVSSDIDIISPLPAVAVVPPSIFSPTVVGNRRMKSDELRAYTCVDTPGWEDSYGKGCDYYGPHTDPGNIIRYECRIGYTGNNANKGVPKEHCCNCGGGSGGCENFRSKCQKYISVEGLSLEDGSVAPLCKEAESFCCEGENHGVEINVPWDGTSETVGLYNECKCNFWSRLCEDTGEACDYAAEYCCGDYQYWEGRRFVDGKEDVDGILVGRFVGLFKYWNSPTCYCDFFTYAQNEFEHTLKPKALNISEEFESPCGINWGRNNDDYEKASLEAIYKGTNGQNWKNNDGWMTPGSWVCEWYGISCDNEYGGVTGIDLRDNNLAGYFPVYTRTHSLEGDPCYYPDAENPLYYVYDNENNWQYTKNGLANLYDLKTLNLADNKLTGTIEYLPLYNLASLTHFDVSGNQLSGEVDALVTPSVKHSDFSNNRFTSMHRFEKYKGSFQTLRYCDISNNAIQTDVTDKSNNVIHSHVTDFFPLSIEQFFASNNQFYGSLPESSNNLPKLRQFNMSSNALSGSLPKWFNDLPQLRQFDMSSNSLSGELPNFAGSISSLQELDMSNQTNGFIGSIPEDLWRFQYLRIMNLAGNKLAGTIPPAIVTMASLNILNLTDNELEGIIPPSIGNMVLLNVLDLSDNLLSSTIPSALGNGKLKLLDLSNNKLSGTIPSQLVQLQGASILLKDNRFDNETAPLSLCLREVKEFDLAFHPIFCQIERNALVEFYDAAKGAKWTDGSLWLDEDAGYCGWKGVTCNVDGRVTKLHLANNGLSGRLSERIRNFNFIEELDLSDNDIEGSIPAEIDSLSYLTYLRLSSNAFTGSIPEDIDLLSKLTYLGLNDNAFNGSIPEDIWTSQSLMIMNLAGNKLSGTIPPTIGDMTVLEELDLSSNSLSGQIPFQIGQLEGAGVLKRLDLANNILSGTIPSQLGQLQNASILLEGNRFNNSAKTAPLSLCMLRNVKEFDLAHDMTFCPIERNALSDFYDSAKGAE